MDLLVLLYIRSWEEKKIEQIAEEILDRSRRRNPGEILRYALTNFYVNLGGNFKSNA